MATHNIFFAQTSGGFNGSNAIVDDNNQFVLDLGKSTSFATLDISDTSGGPVLLDYGTVDGITVRIEDAEGDLVGGEEANTFDTSLFHTTDNAYTEPKTSSVEENPADILNVGGSTDTWGKTWSTNDINNLKIKLNNPTEPNGGGITLKATFIFVVVSFTLTPVPKSITFAKGRINLSQGNITL